MARTKTIQSRTPGAGIDHLNRALRLWPKEANDRLKDEAARIVGVYASRAVARAQTPQQKMAARTIRPAPGPHPEAGSGWCR